MQQNKIIVVDDDVDEIFMLQEIFRAKGIQNALFFSDPEQVLHHLEALTENQLPEVVVSDLKMPKVSGLDLLTRLRADSKYDRIDVIIYSTSGLKHDIEACMQAGAKAYFSKPHLVEEYDTLIDSISVYQ
jgi:two-component system response regulator